MSVDRGFTSAFGGTFGVVVALFVITILIPSILMCGCVGCIVVVNTLPKDRVDEFVGEEGPPYGDDPISWDTWDKTDGGR